MLFCWEVWKRASGSVHVYGVRLVTDDFTTFSDTRCIRMRGEATATRKTYLNHHGLHNQSGELQGGRGGAAEQPCSGDVRTIDAEPLRGVTVISVTLRHLSARALGYVRDKFPLISVVPLHFAPWRVRVRVQRCCRRSSAAFCERGGRVDHGRIRNQEERRRSTARRLQSRSGGSERGTAPRRARVKRKLQRIRHRQEGPKRVQLRIPDLGEPWSGFSSETDPSTQQSDQGRPLFPSAENGKHKKSCKSRIPLCEK